MNKRDLVTLISVGGVLLVLVFYAAYAIIGPTTILNNMNINTNISSQMLFTATGGNSFNTYVDVSAMEQSNANNVVATATDNITITLETDGKEAICCTYDIAWQWAQTDVTVNQYKLSTGGVNEYVLSGSLSESYVTANGNTQTISGITNPMFSKQIPDYNASSLTTQMYAGQICNNTGSLSTKETQVYSLTTNFYNLNVAQDQFRGATLNGSVKVNNVSCEKIVAA